MRTLRNLALTMALCAAAPGCNKSDDSETTSEKKSDESDAGISKVAAADPKLAQALAAASARPTAGDPSAEGGPPANGIFAPGAADKELAKGAAPKITLGSEGAMPRVQLGALPKPGTKIGGTIQIAMQNNPQMGAIPIALSVTIEAKKPAAAPGAEGVKADGPVAMTARITGAKIDAPGAPQELQLTMAKLKGSKVDYEVLPNGAGTGYRYEVAPGVQAGEIKDAVQSLSDTLALLTIPYPDKPLGEGGFWMVTSRGELFGLDLVTYRLIKVEKVAADAVTLKVNTKRYAADSRFNLADLPPNIPPNILEFQANSDGILNLAQGAAIPSSGRIESMLAAAIGSPAAKQRGMFQLQSRTDISLK